MSLIERFSEDEIFLLSSTPLQIGTVMAFAEGSGLGTIKEMFASSKSYINGIKDYPNNDLITGILPSVSNINEVASHSSDIKEATLARLKQLNIKNSDQLREQIIKDSQEVAKILAEKCTPEEANEYKEWTMGIAENVAKVAKEGGFLGIGGTRVSDGEKQAFAEIASALGAQSKLA